MVVVVVGVVVGRPVAVMEGRTSEPVVVLLVAVWGGRA